MGEKVYVVEEKVYVVEEKETGVPRNSLVWKKQRGELETLGSLTHLVGL